MPSYEASTYRTMPIDEPTAPSLSTKLWRNKENLRENTPHTSVGCASSRWETRWETRYHKIHIFVRAHHGVIQTTSLAGDGQRGPLDIWSIGKPRERPPESCVDYEDRAGKSCRKSIAPVCVCPRVRSLTLVGQDRNANRAIERHPIPRIRGVALSESSHHSP